MRSYLIFAFSMIALCSVDIAIASEKNGVPSRASWDKFGFGVGISFSWDLGSNDRVESAEIDGGVVRVTDRDNGLARVTLEGHYFFEKDNFGHGPFVAVQPGEDEIIDAVGIGWMIGLRKGRNEKRSFNLALGIIADPNVKVLGDGFKENEPPPAGETQVRYAEETQGGILLMFSTSW